MAPLHDRHPVSAVREPDADHGLAACPLYAFRRAGLREMALPQAAELVRLLVLELAYRADLGGRD